MLNITNRAGRIAPQTIRSAFFPTIICLLRNMYLSLLTVNRMTVIVKVPANRKLGFKTRK